MTRPRYWMVFDVESIGLHGDAFAVGYVVVDAQTGVTVEEQRWWCPPHRAHGQDMDRAWVLANVLPALEQAGAAANRAFTHQLREDFWHAWSRWKELDAWLAADVPWPVEARFLARCVDDVPGRTWGGPYPLVDVASVRLAAGLDPLETGDRRLGELPVHDPLADARQSARLLLVALGVVPH